MWRWAPAPQPGVTTLPPVLRGHFTHSAAHSSCLQEAAGGARRVGGWTCGGLRWPAVAGRRRVPKEGLPWGAKARSDACPIHTLRGQLPASGSRRGSDAQWPEQVTLHHEPFRTPGPAPTLLAGALGTRPPTKVWRDRPSHCALGGPSLSIFLP